MDGYILFISDLPDDQMRIDRTTSSGARSLTISGAEAPSITIGKTLSWCEFAAAMDRLQEQGFEVIVGEPQTAIAGPHRRPETARANR